MQMLSRPLLVITIAEALTDQSELKQEASGGTTSHASSESESQSDSQTLQSPSDIRYYVMYKSYLLCCIIIV